MECETARCIHAMFEDWADRTPEAEAAVDAGTRLRYGELNARANRLARHLRGHGVGRGERVGICMDRGVGMLEAIFAILKAGAAYVPMDPAYPAERLRGMVEDARPIAILTDRHGLHALVPALASLAPPPLAIDIHAEATAWAAQLAHDLSRDRAAGEDAAGIDIEPGPGDTAYVIYTSGSTGRPKGVEVSHAAVHNLWRGLHALLYPQGAAPLRVALNASLSFDVSVQGWSRLLSGDCVVVPSQSAKLDPVEMLALLAREAVDLFDCTPSQLTGLIAAGLLERPALAAMTVVVAGEAISPPLWSRLQASDGPRFFNAYGPTEATVYATATSIRDAGLSPHVGRPLPGVSIEILDEARAPVAAGVVGELYIGGAGLARGYLHRPELTAERFVDHPLRPGERLYRTGDLGRRRDDGSIDGVIEYLGRNDFQVKVRGFRIELGEIECALADIDGVDDAVVLAREDDADGKRLVAYYRGEAARTPPAALRAALAARLPDYMVPAAYVCIADWPQTANGKLDRAALPPPCAADYATATYAPPQTPTEHALAAMWRELLGRDTIGRDDRFLHLGGDSLRLIQLASRIRAGFERELPIHALFKPQTLAQMAAAIDAGMCDDLRDDTRNAQAEADARTQRSSFDHWPTSVAASPARAPLSYQQYGLWLLERMASTSIAYNAQNVIRIRGDFDPARLARAVERLTARHDILRTTFHDGDGRIDAADSSAHDSSGQESAGLDSSEPYQIVHPDAPAVFEYRELDAPPDEGGLTAIVETYVRHRFDLAQLPLIRFVLHKLAPQDYLLIQIEHHFVHDGWSMNLILRELLELYDADARGVDANLPPPGAQYRDYALWQRSEAAQARFLAQARYWARKLEGAPLELPIRTDVPRPSAPSYAGDQVRVVLPAELGRRLRAYCRSEGVTLFAAMQAAYRMTIAHYAGTDDFLIGSAVANRTAQKTEGMVGMFVNMIPVRCDLSGDPSYRALIERVTSELAEGYEHQEAPFDWVVREIHPDREYARNPLFQTAFSTHNSLGPQLRWPQFALKIHEVYSNRTSKFDFDLVMIPRSADDPEGITIFWEYCVDLYRRDTIERLNASYLRVLAQCVERPELRLSEVDFLGAEERARLVEGGYRAIDVPAAPIHAAFEAHAARTPTMPAVEDAGAVVDYAELNARANRLARHLRALGLGPERSAALCMERSTAAIEAVLATLKAGGAYVPLDPMQPEERLGFMLADAQARIVLTDRANRAQVERIVAAMPRAPAADTVQIVDLDADADLWAQRDAQNLDPVEIGLTPAHLAYIVYTSGSTGTPKGVMVEHRQIAAIVAGWQAQYALAPGLRHLQMASLAFDVFTADLLRALGHGGCLVLCPRETLSDPAALSVLLREARIDVADFVPVVLDALVAHLEASGRDLAFMRTIVCGSDRWSADAAHRARRVVGEGVRLLHAYGLTETSVDSACHEIAPLAADARPPSSLPIGDAVANARMLVLDRDRRPVPIGVVGELYVGGAGVARGYLARPELQAERFIDSPFHPGERLYRTGDLGRRLAEGGIEFLGRNDSQVKIRGHRVELGEIEARLRALHDIDDAVILLRADDGGEPALVAYALAKAGGALPSVQAMHDALRATLPVYMVPNAFVAMEAWPQTANGKLDRAALPLPETTAFVVADTYLAPRTPIEEAIAEIWCEVLGVERVGVYDDFFRLGGHSLLAMRAMVAIRDAFGIDLPLRRLFDAPTVEGLADALLDESILDESMERIEA